MGLRLGLRVRAQETLAAREGCSGGSRSAGEADRCALDPPLSYCRMCSNNCCRNTGGYCSKEDVEPVGSVEE